MKPDQNVYYKKTYGKLGIILWHLIICKKEKKKILKVKHNYLTLFSSFEKDG